jgi:hypothetical protein
LRHCRSLIDCCSLVHPSACALIAASRALLISRVLDDLCRLDFALIRTYFSNMSNFMNAFSSHKRKRSLSDAVAGISEPEWKRRTTSLPFRSPSQQRPASIFPPANSTWTSAHGTLTPIDTSEDESVTNENETLPSNFLPSLNDSQTSVGSNSTSSVRVEVDAEDHDIEMAMSSPTRPRAGRARSNDIMSSPHRRPNFLAADPSHTPTRDRIPTPIASHFDYRQVQLPSNPRHSFPPLRTNLSPTVEQETWALGPDGLPSPTEYSPQINDSDAMMSGLQLHCDGDDTLVPGQMHPTQQLASGLDSDDQTSHHCSHARQASGRSARLHMGYLAGCEKCAQKVPGHYSHILWS